MTGPLEPLRRARVWLVSWLIWSGLGAFALAQTAASRAMHGRGAQPMAGVLLTLESMWLWAVITPVILALCLHLSLERNHRMRSLAWHAVAAVAIAVADVVIDTPFVAWLAPGDRAVAPRFIQEAFINIFSYASTAGICYALTYSRQLADRRARDAVLEAELLRARLDAVAARLHPHFLFNALHSVTALIRTGEPNAAVRAVVALSALLRAALESDGEAQVPLARELDWVRNYLDIEQIRFQDRLVVELSVTGDIDGAMVPALLLQPLVENAIRHGVGARTGNGRVVIAAWRDGDQLRLDVEDASTDGSAATIETTGTGLGLRATRERLEHLFGTAYSLELESTRIGSHARIALPYRAEAP
ncbi:MAG: histidine kinase [Kofleriaceae bacterium]